MQIRFDSTRMQQLCSSDKAMRRKWGDGIARKLQQRMSELSAADTLAVLARLPAARCHELHGERRGQLAVDLVHPHRLVFQPDHVPFPAKPDGGLDWTRVTKIVVLEVVDYH